MVKILVAFLRTKLFQLWLSDIMMMLNCFLRVVVLCLYLLLLSKSDGTCIVIDWKRCAKARLGPSRNATTQGKDFLSTAFNATWRTRGISRYEDLLLAMRVGSDFGQTSIAIYRYLSLLVCSSCPSSSLHSSFCNCNCICNTYLTTNDHLDDFFCNAFLKPCHPLQQKSTKSDAAIIEIMDD